MRRTPAELLRIAWHRRGVERESAIAATKTISALLPSYAVAVWVLNSQVAVFAPFAAFFTVQATIYRSVWHAVRYLVAVIVGIATTGLVGATLGETFWTLSLLIAGTVLLGQWRGFGGYGSQIPVVGLFALAAGGGDESGYLVDLLLTVLAGTMTGFVANLVFAPRLRFNDAARAVADIATGVRDLLCEIAEGLRDDEPLTRVDSWRDRIHELDALVDRVHADIDFREEALRLNPRRALMSQPTLADSRTTIIAISAVVDHTESITRALLYADRSDGHGMQDELLSAFLPRFADLLEAVASAVASFGHQTVGTGDNLSDRLGNAYRLHHQLAQSIANVEPSDSRMLADCGTMLQEAERVLTELRTNGDRWTSR